LNVPGVTTDAAARREIDAINENKDKILHQFKNYQEKARGLSEDELDGLIATKDQVRRDKAKAEGDWADLEKEIRSETSQQVSALQGKLDKADQRYDDMMFERDAILALDKAKGSAKLLLPHMKERRKVVVDEHGNRRLVILGQTGRPMIGTDGEDATMDDLVAEFQKTDEFKRAFDGTGSTGSGKGPSTRTSRASNNPFETGNITEIAKLKRDNPAAFVELRRSASKMPESVTSMLAKLDAG